MIDDAPQDVYAQLTAPFTTHQRTQAGVDLDYITGEQCISRLNKVLGVDNWSHTIKEHLVVEDEVLVLVHLDATVPGPHGERRVEHEAWGSQQIKRRKNDQKPLDLGYDFKGATTDALKKAATHLGVALYLSSKEKDPVDVAEQGSAPSTRSAATPSSGASTTRPEASQNPPPPPDNPTPKMLELVGTGYKPASGEQMPKFWTEVQKRFGYDERRVLALLGTQDVDTYLRNLQTDLASLFKLVNAHSQTRAPLPKLLPLGRFAEPVGVAE